MDRYKFRVYSTKAKAYMPSYDYYIDCDGVLWEGAAHTYNTPNKEIETIDVDDLVIEDVEGELQDAVNRAVDRSVRAVRQRVRFRDVVRHCG